MEEKKQIGRARRMKKFAVRLFPLVMAEALFVNSNQHGKKQKMNNDNTRHAKVGEKSSRGINSI